eukprot:EG_transcript_13131
MSLTPPHLPGEVWLLIADYLQTPALSHVCHHTWSALHGRHLTCWARPATLQRKLLTLRGDPTLESLAITAVADFAEVDVEALRPLRYMPSLRSVTLSLENAGLTDGAAVMLTRLRLATQLTALQLSLAGNGTLQAAGAKALATLADTPSLEVLHLSLCGCRLKDRGVEALSRLRHATHLRSVHLNLWGNGVRDAGAIALAELRHLPRLRTLRLYLSANSIGDVGAEGLSALGRCTSLTTLELMLEANKIGDAGCQALASLRSSPLRSLTLNLRGNCVGDGGGQALAMLRLSSTIMELNLRLSRNRLGDGAAVALAGLAEAPALRRLALGLRRNRLGPAGKAALAALAGQPHRWDRLTVDVDLNEAGLLNGIGPGGGGDPDCPPCDAADGERGGVQAAQRNSLLCGTAPDLT